MAYTLPLGTVTTATSFNFTPNDDGNYIVTLTATDKDGGVGSASKTINVNNAVPTVVINGAPVRKLRTSTRVHRGFTRSIRRSRAPACVAAWSRLG